MKSLIVEDEIISLTILEKLLGEFGPVSGAVNGNEAMKLVDDALASNDYFNLICLDIMMPEMDGHTALKKIRMLEEQNNLPSEKSTKIIMTSALNDFDHIRSSYANLCDGYLVKPIDKTRLRLELRRLELI